ncbi:MAG: ribonuclease H [gamma proteobacterium symbiont of Ctena orbiculata]|nr:MAG: ribonuclease H [gamma proteobacterium symbiont of Ctena orbiculata]
MPRKVSIKSRIFRRSRIFLGLKSLAAYSMLAYEHDDDPEDLDEIVQEGLDAIDRLFNC